MYVIKHSTLFQQPHKHLFLPHWAQCWRRYKNKKELFSCGLQQFTTKMDFIHDTFSHMGFYKAISLKFILIKSLRAFLHSRVDDSENQKVVFLNEAHNVVDFPFLHIHKFPSCILLSCLSRHFCFFFFFLAQSTKRWKKVLLKKNIIQK